MSTGQASRLFEMIPRIRGHLDNTGCADHHTSVAENSGLTCSPRITGPPQRSHTIGGKLLGGLGCLRRARRVGLFGVGYDIMTDSIEKTVVRIMIAQSLRPQPRLFVASPDARVSNASSDSPYREGSAIWAPRASPWGPVAPATLRATALAIFAIGPFALSDRHYVDSAAPPAPALH